MLEIIRRATTNKLGRIALTILFSLLILSFAAWGIGDVFQNGQRQVAAVVGNAEIPAEDFETRYRDAINTLSQRLGRFVKNDEARLLGLPNQILNAMISRAVLDHDINAKNLYLSEEDAARIILDNPIFADSSGVFDKNRFTSYLFQARISEKQFIANQKGAILRGQFLSSLFTTNDSPVSEIMLRNLSAHAAEKRDILMAPLTPDLSAITQTPDEKTLEAYFKNNKRLFRTPERRSATIAALFPEDLGARLSVSEAELQAAYEQAVREGLFGEPEKRRAQQILFPNAEEANAARKKLDEGATFEDILKERKLSLEDVDLGFMSRDAFFDPTTAATIFALAENGVSQVIETRFGHALYRVNEIAKGFAPPLSEVTSSLRSKIINDRINGDAELISRRNSLRERVEKARTKGESLEEIAARLPLKLQKVMSIDAQGVNAKGDPVTLLGGETLLPLIFRSDVALDNEIITLPGGGLAWFNVTRVTPERDETFAQARRDVIPHWREAEALKALKKKTQRLVARINAGEAFETIAKDAGLTIRRRENLAREDAMKIGARAISRIFSSDVETAFSILNNNEYQIIQVVAKRTPAFAPASSKVAALRERIRKERNETLLNLYLGHIQKNLEITINETILARIIGEDSSL